MRQTEATDAGPWAGLMTFPWGSDSVDSACSLAGKPKPVPCMQDMPGESRAEIMCSDPPHAILIAARCSAPSHTELL